MRFPDIVLYTPHLACLKAKRCRIHAEDLIGHATKREVSADQTCTWAVGSALFGENLEGRFASLVLP